MTSPGSTPSCSAMRFASSGCERPANTMSRFHGPRSIQCPGPCSLMTWLPSSPGRATSVALTLSMPVVDPPFLRLLPRGEPGERSRGDIIGDDRARCNPSIVANVDRSIERIVDAGPDVTADAGLGLRLARLVLEIGGDISGGGGWGLAGLRGTRVRQGGGLRAGPRW